MVIKYYENGWNYIDDVSLAKVNKYEYKDFIEKAKLNMKTTVIQGDNDIVDYNYDLFSEYALEVTENKINDRIWYRHNRFDRKHREIAQEHNPLITVVSFYNNKKQRFEMVMFSNPSFLLNDSGKTIDSL